MRDNLTRGLARYQKQFASFTAGQKVVAILGTGALLLAAFMVFRWAATPSMAPLYTNLASADASAVIEQLDAEGVPYEITGNGGTIMVPKSEVYSTRISLSGEGLPGNSSEGGYSLLDNQDISTSQFQEQTDFKRAMEGELATTIEALDGVDTAVVHLALPAKQVFADEQDPPTASVLVDTQPGAELDPTQVQAVVHLVASSIDGLDPDKVTVADAAGRVLSAVDGTDGAAATTRAQQVEEFQSDLNTKIQTMLDRVLGPGNSTVSVTANLDFDKSVTDSTTYTTDPNSDPLSSSSNVETYNGPAGGTGIGGVVGTDGQMETGIGGPAGSAYKKESLTEDNAVDTTVEHRETAPGGVQSLHTAVVLDAAAARNVDPGEIEGLVSDAIGIDQRRGDTIQVSMLPFDRTAEDAAAAELAAAAKAAKDAEKFDVLRKAGLGLLVALLLVIVWFKGRRRNKARENATTMVVEQLRLDQAARAALPVEPPAPALAVLERAEHSATEEMRGEIAALVERQPEDVAALLRGWLVER